MLPALAVVALLAVGPGGGRPPLPVLPRVGAIPVAAVSFELDGGVLYRVEPDTANTVGVAADDVLTGRRLWRTALSGPVDLVQTVLAAGPAGGGVVLARSGLSPAVSWVSALDARTGRVLWGAPARVDVAVLAGGVVLLSSAPDGPNEVLAVDAHTGRTIWRATPPAGTTVVAGVDRVLLSRLDGQAEVLAADSGALLGAGSLGGVGHVLLVTGEAVYAQSPTDAGRLYRLDLTTFRRHLLLGLPDAIASLRSCGPVLCARMVDGDLVGVDPHTGDPRWRDPRLTIVDLVGGGHLVTAGPHPAVLDAATGRVLLRLSGDRVGASGSGAPLYRVENDAGAALLATLDLASARLVPVGRLSGPAPDDVCGAASGRLACLVGDQFVMWRYPVPPG